MEITEKVRSEYQMRKTKEQKDAFIELIQDFCKENKYPFKKEEGIKGIISKNIIIGDINEAEFICTAHYDTCVVSPFANFIAPKNPRLALFKELKPFFITALPLALILGVVNLSVGAFIFTMIIEIIIEIILYKIYQFVGKPNKHTENDNTSGVITLLSIMSLIPEESRSKVAFVFFDNEEKGLLGAKFFKKKHKHLEKLVINFDCVSDGDHILIIFSEEAMKSHRYESLKKNFKENLPFGKQVIFEKSEGTSSNSDEKIFQLGIRVVALKKDSKNRLYLDRIHTKHDIKFDKKNIDYLTKSICSFCIK